MFVRSCTSRLHTSVICICDLSMNRRATAKKKKNVCNFNTFITTSHTIYNTNNDNTSFQYYGKLITFS